MCHHAVQSVPIVPHISAFNGCVATPKASGGRFKSHTRIHSMLDRDLTAPIPEFPALHSTSCPTQPMRARLKQQGIHATRRLKYGTTQQDQGPRADSARFIVGDKRMVVPEGHLCLLDYWHSFPRPQFRIGHRPSLCEAWFANHCQGNETSDGLA
jgi:hypothetical protein